MSAIFHIGGNKTGSTTLQRRLFSKHPNVCYLGEDCDGYDKLKPWLDSLVAEDDSFFDFEEIKGIFLERFGSGAEGRACVFSNEDIMTSAMPSVCASRLKKLDSDAQIVMVVRNQLTVWPSWYANHGAYLKNVPRGYWRKHVSLEDWLDYCFSFPKQTPVEAMNYERFFKIFRETFSASQIHVLLYEDLLQDPAGYYKKWSEILKISDQDIGSYMASHIERRRHSVRRMNYDKLISQASVIPGLEKSLAALFRYAVPLREWVDSGPPARIELPEIWRARIANYYRKTNASLAEMTGLDLAQYGYPL